MPNYKTPDGSLAVWVDDGSDPADYGNGLIPCSDAEAAAIMAARTPSVPASVSMRQARLALLGAGLLSSVDAAIAALPSPAKEAAQIEWDYASEVQRDNALIASLASGLGLTEAQIDDLFITAATL